MHKIITYFILTAAIFIAYNCASEKRISKKYIDQNYGVNDHSVKLSIAPITGKNGVFADSALAMIYDNTEKPFMLYSVENFRDQVSLDKKFDELITKIKTANTQNDTDAQNLKSLIGIDNFKYLKQNLANSDLLLIPDGFNLKHKSFTTRRYQSNAPAFRSYKEITFTYRTSTRLQPRRLADATPLLPEKYSIAEFHNSLFDNGLGRSWYSQGKARFLLYDLNSGQLVYNVSVKSDFEPTIKYASARLIDQSYHFFINQLYKNPTLNRSTVRYYFDKNYKISNKTDVTLTIAPILRNLTSADSTLTAIYGNTTKPYTSQRVNIFEEKLSTQLKIREIFRKIIRENSGKISPERINLTSLTGSEDFKFLKKNMNEADLLLIPFNFDVGKNNGHFFSKHSSFAGAAQFMLFDLNTGALIYNVKFRSDADWKDPKSLSTELIVESHKFLENNIF